VASVRIMSSIEGDKLTEAAAVASILLVVALIAIVVLDVISRRVARYA
jgi:sulfate transport system permease protein